MYLRQHFRSQNLKKKQINFTDFSEEYFNQELKTNLMKNCVKSYITFENISLV